jgi:hypothetical protein
MRRLLAIPAVLLLALPALALAKASIEAPSSAHVGDSVRASAEGLSKEGRYALTLAADHVSGRDNACVARLATASKASTAVSLAGQIPAKLTCWTNNSVRLGRIDTDPGPYHLIVAIPEGPAGFRGTFVRTPIKIRP